MHHTLPVDVGKAPQQLVGVKFQQNGVQWLVKSLELKVYSVDSHRNEIHYHV